MITLFTSLRRWCIWVKISLFRDKFYPNRATLSRHTSTPLLQYALILRRKSVSELESVFASVTMSSILDAHNVRLFGFINRLRDKYN